MGLAPAGPGPGLVIPSGGKGYFLIAFLIFIIMSAGTGSILWTVFACSAIFFISSVSVGAEAVNGHSMPRSLQANVGIVSPFSPFSFSIFNPAPGWQNLFSESETSGPPVPCGFRLPAGPGAGSPAVPELVFRCFPVLPEKIPQEIRLQFPELVREHRPLHAVE